MKVKNKEYKEYKDRVWVKEGKMYTIIKPNCRKCMGKRYVIRNFIQGSSIKEVVLSCSCVVEQSIKERNVNHIKKENNQ